MTRYSILLNKSVEQKFLDGALQAADKEEENRRILFNSQKFRCTQGPLYRIAFIPETFKESPIVGARVHFFNRFFLCKSTVDHRAICCTDSVFNKAVYRSCSLIVWYTGNLVELKFWVFGTRTTEKLKTVNLRKGFDYTMHERRLSNIGDCEFW